MGEQWAVALGQKKTELFLNEGWSSPDQVKCAGKWGGWLPSPGSASSPRPLSSCSYTSSLPAPQHIQPWLLLISNTPISKNQVPGALPKPRALKKIHSQFPSCARPTTPARHNPSCRGPDAELLWGQGAFSVCFSPRQLPGCDGLLWEGPLSSPGNRVIREYQFQNYAAKKAWSLHLTSSDRERLQLSIRLSVLPAWGVLPSPKGFICSEAVTAVLDS